MAFILKKPHVFIMYTYLVIYDWIYPIFSPKITKFRTPAENNGLLSTGVTIFEHGNDCFLFGIG